MIDNETRLKIAKDYAAGVKVCVIAATYGVDGSTPQKIAMKLGFKQRRPSGKKVTNPQEYKIVESYLCTSATYKELSEKFGVTIRQISNILDRNGVVKYRRIPKHDDE